MATDYAAPWDIAFNPGQVTQTGQGELSIGRTYPPETQLSADVPSAAQAAPPEAGDGPDYSVHDDFGIPGLSISYIDQTPYEPPGVGPSVSWDAPPWETNKIRGIDQGAPKFFNSEIEPDKGTFQVTDVPVGSYAYGINTDNLGNKVLTDIGRPEHNIDFVVQRDNSPHRPGYQERPQFNNIALPAPYVQSEAPSQYVPNAAYPDLGRNSFAAEAYAQPPDPAQAVAGYSGGYGSDYESEWA